MSNASDRSLYNAVQTGDLEKVVKLIKDGHDINAFGPWNSSPLDSAINNGHTEIALKLIQSGANLYNENNNVFALTSAVHKNDTDIVKAILKAQIDQPYHEEAMATTLCHPRSLSNSKAVKLLISAKANINFRDNNGETPLIRAISNNNQKTIKLLIDAGADLDLQDKNGTTALIGAINRGNDDLIAPLIQANANLDLQDKHGNTALMRAVSNDQIETATQLVEAGADPFIKNDDCQNALDIALKLNRKAFINLLSDKTNGEFEKRSTTIASTRDVLDNGGLIITTIFNFQAQSLTTLVDDHGTKSSSSQTFNQVGTHPPLIKAAEFLNQNGGHTCGWHKKNKSTLNLKPQKTRQSG